MSDSTDDSGPTDLVPTNILRDGESAIEIVWSDETTSRWTIAQLRDACPCATCREKRRGEDQKAGAKTAATLPVLSAAEARPLVIESMRPVGSYAYNISFSDGHSSGIFTMGMLYQGPEQRDVAREG